MKVNTSFENVADQLFAELQDKQYRAKAWERKKHWGKDSKYSMWERIGIVFACFVFTIAAICGAIINAELIDKIPVWGWTLFVLACIVSVVIFYRGKIDRKKANKDY